MIATTATTNHYAATLEEGERNAHVHRDWVHEQIRCSDLLMWELELLNKAGVEKAPEKLREQVCLLGLEVGLERRHWPQATQELLDLVFDGIQEALMELGGYRGGRELGEETVT